MTEPRDPLEDLARLGAQAPMLGGARGGTGPARWTALDIAAALSGYAHGDLLRLREGHGPTLLAMVKYAFDRGSVYPLVVTWWLRVIDLAIEGGWRGELNSRAGVRARLMADATLEEFLCGAHCAECGGTGLQHNQQTCPTCDGFTQQVRGEWWWAMKLQCRRENVAPWMPRIRTCFVELQDWEAQARGAYAAGRKEGEILPLDSGQ